MENNLLPDDQYYLKTLNSGEIKPTDIKQTETLIKREKATIKSKTTKTKKEKN